MPHARIYLIVLVTGLVRYCQVNRFEGLLSGRPLPKFLILHSADDRFRLQNPGIPLNLNIPLGFSSII